MKTNDKVKEAINGIIKLFESGEIPKAIAIAVNPVINVPSSKWSLRNKLIMFFNGTGDARGFRQWGEMRRQVKKGSKAFYILAPMIKKFQEVDENGKAKEVDKLVGFRGTAVFRVEDTEGDPLDYEKIELPVFTFQEVAENWGIKIKSVGGGVGYFGAYSPNTKEILMASPDEQVFTHELAHSGHDRAGLLKKRNSQQREIVAEFVSCVLAYMMGKKAQIGNTYEYLKHYAGEEKVERAVLNLIGDIEKVLKIILDTQKELKIVIENKSQ